MAPLPAHVPWLVRRQIGEWTAYWRTVSMVILRSREFAQQVFVTSSGDASGGESFRRITVVLATISCALTAGLFQLLDATRPIDAAAPKAIAFGGIAIFALWVFFWIVTLPVRVDLFRPGTWNIVFTFRYLQKFGCAGLALSPAIPLCAAFAVAAARFDQRALAAQALALTYVAIAVVILAWWNGAATYVCLAGRPGAVQAAEALVWWLLRLLAGALAAAGTALAVLRLVILFTT
jgi:hypothetical protein